MMSSLPSSDEGQEKKKTWIGLIDESVHTSDDVDIGDIDAVSRDFVVVKRGFVNVHYYYIPLNKVEGWEILCKITMIPSRYTRPIYPGIGTITSTKTAPASDVPTILKCDICGSSEFKTEDDLSYHIRTMH